MFLRPSFVFKPAIIGGQIKSYSKYALQQDINRLKEAWDEAQCTRDRDGIYTFLGEVFDLIAWWKAESKAGDRSMRMLIACDLERAAREPYANAIVAAAAPKRLDKRLVSKWSRTLRLAAELKAPDESLKDFVKARGGINACTRLYAARLRRRARKR